MEEETTNKVEEEKKENLLDFFIGLDPSLNSTGVVVLDKHASIALQKIVSAKKGVKDINEKLLTLQKQIEEIKETYKPSYICIEGLSHGSTGQAILELAGLHYLITTILYRDKNLFEEVSPGTLKKFVTGVGNAKKELMLLKIYKKWKVEFTTNDEADAYALARFALEKGFPKCQQLHLF